MLTVSGAILAYLLSDIRHAAPETFADLLDKPKNWWCFAAAPLCYTTALLVGLFRWYLLGVVLRFNLRFRDIIRIGSFAYIVEILSIGLAGADAARATMLARTAPKFAASAIISVLFDRLLGGYALLCFVSLNGWIANPTDGVVQAALHTLQAMTVGATLGLVLWLLFPRLAPWVSGRALRFGRAGNFVAQAVETVDVYRSHLPLLALAFAQTIIVLTLTSTSFFLLASGTPGGAPTWQEHTLIVPLLLLSALVPLPMQGLGVVDYTLSYLYQHAAAAPPHVGQGLVVAMAVRLTSISVGGLAALYYALSRPPVGSTHDDL